MDETTHFTISDRRWSDVRERLAEVVSKMEGGGIATFQTGPAGYSPDEKRYVVPLKAKTYKRSEVPERALKYDIIKEIMVALLAGSAQGTWRDVYYFLRAKGVPGVAESWTKMRDEWVLDVEGIVGANRESFGVMAGARGFVHGPGSLVVESTGRRADLMTIPFLQVNKELNEARLMTPCNKVLLVEKEGQARWLCEQGVPSLLNTLIVTTSGYTSRDARRFLGTCGAEGLAVCMIHDGDADGLYIGFTTKHWSQSEAILDDRFGWRWAFDFGVNPRMMKMLGMEPDDAQTNWNAVKLLAERGFYNPEDVALLQAETKYEMNVLNQAIHGKALAIWLIECYRRFGIDLKPVAGPGACKAAAVERLIRSAEYDVRSAIERPFDVVESRISDVISEIRREVVESWRPKMEADLAALRDRAESELDGEKLHRRLIDRFASDMTQTEIEPEYAAADADVTITPSEDELDARVEAVVEEVETVLRNRLTDALTHGIEWSLDVPTLREPRSTSKSDLYDAALEAVRKGLRKEVEAAVNDEEREIKQGNLDRFDDAVATIRGVVDAHVAHLTGNDEAETHFKATLTES